MNRVAQMSESGVLIAQGQLPATIDQSFLIVWRDEPLEEAQRQSVFRSNDRSRERVTRLGALLGPTRAERRCIGDARPRDAHCSALSPRADGDLGSAWSERERASRLAEVQGYPWRESDPMKEAKTHNQPPPRRSSLLLGNIERSPWAGAGQRRYAMKRVPPSA